MMSMVDVELLICNLTFTFSISLMVGWIIMVIRKVKKNRG